MFCAYQDVVTPTSVPFPQLVRAPTLQRPFDLLFPIVISSEEEQPVSAFSAQPRRLDAATAQQALHASVLLCSPCCSVLSFRPALGSSMSMSLAAHLLHPPTLRHHHHPLTHLCQPSPTSHQPAKQAIHTHTDTLFTRHQSFLSRTLSFKPDTRHLLDQTPPPPTSQPPHLLPTARLPAFHPVATLMPSVDETLGPALCKACSDCGASGLTRYADTCQP